MGCASSKATNTNDVVLTEAPAAAAAKPEPVPTKKESLPPVAAPSALSPEKKKPAPIEIKAESAGEAAAPAPPRDAAAPAPPTSSTGSVGTPRRAAAFVASAKATKFILETFGAIGEKKTLKPGELLVEQGVVAEHIWCIANGTCDLLLRSDGGDPINVARRSIGDVIGELSLLLGFKTTVAVVASDEVEVIQVEQSKLLEMLKEEGKKKQAGQLFKLLATSLSERIAELSGKMRSNVVTAQAPTKGNYTQRADIGKVRGEFNVSDDAKLMGVYECSVRRETNAIKEQHTHFGEVYIFDHALCFDLKMFAFQKKEVLPFAEIAGFLKPAESTDAAMIEVQYQGGSLELHISSNFEEATQLMEACRVKSKATAMSTLQSLASGVGEDGMKRMSRLSVDIEDFHQMVDPIIGHDDHKSNSKLVDLDLKEEDWNLFLGVAKQVSFRKGEYIMKEGQATCTLYQIIRGRLRVELEIAGQAQAVVVGYRSAGEMLGETSLLKAGKATASLAADEDTTVVMMEGKPLMQLFAKNPTLPSRFFCFLAVYQAERLFKLTQQFGTAKTDVVASAVGPRVPAKELLGDAAFAGIFRKFLAKGSEQEFVHAFDLYVKAEEFKSIPDKETLIASAKDLAARHISDRSSACVCTFLSEDVNTKLAADADALKEGTLSLSAARKMFISAQEAAVTHLERGIIDDFYRDASYGYILDIKAKAGRIASLADFKVMRVLGEGGFGQVIEVTKRDSGSRYAMKVMSKEKMKENLGSAWRKKIATEQQVMAALHHPFLVNLKYAFQNSDYLVLVMDLVASGDLSEFVLSKKKRLNAEQTKWALMEVVEVMSYIHDKNILFRDLKPENLLVDDEGHVRLCDMGLAAYVTKRNPTRTSRVGTDCYMAPEIRFARKRRQPYGKSSDWYTVGVLLYEFSNGALPYTQRDSETPKYRPGHFPNPACQSLCEGLLVQDYKVRIGTKSYMEIKNHEYFAGVDWDVVTSLKIPSPMKGVKGVPKKKKDKEAQAQRTAAEITAADERDHDSSREDPSKEEYNIGVWDFTSATVASEEYLESMYSCVSNF